MSVKLMSAIFETEFRDLPIDEGESMAKASSLKIVMLAIADHANDQGESAYPGLKKLQRKTGLSRQGLINVIAACKYNGLLYISDEPSRLGTNDYTIELSCYPCLSGEDEERLLVKPLDQSSHLTGGSQVTLPPLVKPLDTNHHLTTIKTSLGAEAPSVEWAIVSGQPVTEDMLDNDGKYFEKDAQDAAWLISQNNADLEPLAMAFMMARRILPPLDQTTIKGWRKAFRDMKNSRPNPVQAEHVTKAVRNLREKQMTISDPFAVIKTARDLANSEDVQGSQSHAL